MGSMYSFRLKVLTGSVDAKSIELQRRVNTLILVKQKIHTVARLTQPVNVLALVVFFLLNNPRENTR